MRGGKKRDDTVIDDNDSEPSDKRTDENRARVFSSAASAGGYIPHHKEPPRYIRVKAHNKKNREFNRVFLAQELAGTLRPADDEPQEQQPRRSGTSVSFSGRSKLHVETGGPVWAMEFSQDGKHLAVAGRDQIVRVFAVISTPEERKAHQEEDGTETDNVGSERLSAPVFQSKPVREFSGHSGEILDISWSKNNFILSAAMDKTVRLWHMSRNECLCTFRHKDLVPSIAFHPRDDRFFLAGCVDSTLRLWSIPDKSVAYSTQLPGQSIITAVAFSPDGMTSIAGVLNGLCLFYETEGLKYHTQIHVRSSRGKNAKGSKITGIQTMATDGGGGDGDVKVLVTSNDSRIRVYNLKDKSLEVKFKGHENIFSQMRGNFSDDAKYIVCGSEDKKVFIWSTGAEEAENKDKRPCESFDAHSAMVTAALFAPMATRQLLGGSGDPIYDLCNPPPVTLLSREEATASQTALSEHSGSEAPSRFRGHHHPEESPAYIARSTHYDGNIIVTSDRTGIIRVFRQDCAFQKRRHENWETGSLSRKFTGGGGLLGRSGSILTRTSAGSLSHSRRASISHSANGTPMSSDRILSWRQDIESGAAGGRNGSLGGTPAPSERSMSPSKGTRTPINTSAANLGSGARRHPYLTSPALRSSLTPSPTSERFPMQPPTPSFSFRSIEERDEPQQQAGGLGSLWGLTSRWRGIVRNSPLAGPSSSSSSAPKDSAKDPAGEGAAPESKADKNDSLFRRRSFGAGVSSKTDADRERRKSVGAPVRESESNKKQQRSVGFDDGVPVSEAPPSSDQPESTTEGEESACVKCGGNDFKAKRIEGRQRFLCRSCGTLVEYSGDDGQVEAGG